VYGRHGSLTLDPSRYIGQRWSLRIFPRSVKHIEVFIIKLY